MTSSLESDSIVNFENIVGSNHNDVIYGNALLNIIRPWRGNDTVDGRDSPRDWIMYNESLAEIYADLMNNKIYIYNYNEVDTVYNIE
jgi:hypothetical protein